MNTIDEYEKQILSKININGTSYIMPKTNPEKQYFAIAVCQHVDYLVNPSIIKKNEVLIQNLVETITSKIHRDDELFQLCISKLNQLKKDCYNL